MRNINFFYVLIFLLGLTVTNEIVNYRPQRIGQLEAEKILGEMNFLKMRELIKSDKETIGENNIKTLYKFSYSLLLNAPTSKELDKKLSFFEFIKEKYPYNLNLFEDSRVLRFKNKLIITICILLIFFYYNLTNIYESFFLLTLFLCPFFNLIYLKKLSDILPYSLVFFIFHFLSLFFPDKRSLFWTRNKSFYGFSFYGAMKYTLIFAIAGNITLFLSTFGLTVSFSEYFTEFFTRSFFYFVFPWIFLTIISAFIITISYGIYITNDSVCVLGLFNIPSLPLFFSKKDILNLVIKNNILTVNFKDERTQIRIKRFYLKDQIIDVNFS